MRTGTCRRVVGPLALSRALTSAASASGGPSAPARHKRSPRDPFGRRIDRLGGHGGPASAADFALSAVSIAIGLLVPQLACLLLERVSALRTAGRRGESRLRSSALQRRCSSGAPAMASSRFAFFGGSSIMATGLAQKPAIFRPVVTSDAVPTVLSRPFVGSVAISPGEMPSEQNIHQGIASPRKNRLMA